MSNHDQNGVQYRPYAGVDVSVSDNNIGAGEYVIRDCMAHVYEEGLQRSETPFFSTGDILAGAAISFLGNGIVEWLTDSNSDFMPNIILGLISIALAIWFYYRKFKRVADRKSDFENRDIAVENQIRKLVENSTPKSTASSDSKKYYR